MIFVHNDEIAEMDPGDSISKPLTEHNRVSASDCIWKLGSQMGFISCLVPGPVQDSGRHCVHNSTSTNVNNVHTESPPMLRWRKSINCDMSSHDSQDETELQCQFSRHDISNHSIDFWQPKTRMWSRQAPRFGGPSSMATLVLLRWDAILLRGSDLAVIPPPQFLPQWWAADTFSLLGDIQTRKLEQSRADQPGLHQFRFLPLPQYSTQSRIQMKKKAHLHQQTQHQKKHLTQDLKKHFY
jgi:hypothetical protein